MKENYEMRREEFSDRVKMTLDSFNEEDLYYHEDEFWMIEHPYSYIEYYAMENHLYNTAIALPIARALHNGGYRKATTHREGKTYRLPYVIHCLLVCRMLVDLNLPLSDYEKDIVLAAALCHDMIEDIPFPEKGKELITYYHLDPLVYETVKLVSKRKDFTDEEHQAYFDNIQANKLALLVKLSDRSNNVEDLYNMKTWKVHEYVWETNTYFLPMCAYGKENYKDLYECIEILLDKIRSLTEVAVTFVDRYVKQEEKMIEQKKKLEEENRKLWEELRQLPV